MGLRETSGTKRGGEVGWRIKREGKKTKRQKDRNRCDGWRELGKKRGKRRKEREGWDGRFAGGGGWGYLQSVEAVEIYCK